MVIDTEGLSFNFGKQTVVKSLSLKVPEGSIYGFLGPNGAGKTTTIKLLLNLLKTQEGSIRIFEKELQSNSIEILSQIGSLIEQPAIYLHLSGKENLLNRALLLQVPEKRVNEILYLVHLTNAAHKKAEKKNFVDQFNITTFQLSNIATKTYLTGFGNTGKLSCPSASTDCTAKR
ncbi:MAG TPA: hypothetical protein DCO83_09655 [Mucilaginibacter sp.]|jgi:ABC-2 type transport system ATP-binding protein|nr:hypothetical protein [Mucilaginibacter sp.]